MIKKVAITSLLFFSSILVNVTSLAMQQQEPQQPANNMEQPTAAAVAQQHHPHVVSFVEIQERVLQAIRAHQHATVIAGESGGFTILPGFFSFHLENEFRAGSINISGPAQAVVALVGNTSGRMYLFALSKLLPDLGL